MASEDSPHFLSRLTLSCSLERLRGEPESLGAERKVEGRERKDDTLEEEEELGPAIKDAGLETGVFCHGE